MVTINIEKKYFFLFSAIMIFIIGVGLVISANPISKVNPGHDSTEIMVNIEGNDKTLQQAIDAGDFTIEALGTGWLDVLVTEVSICLGVDKMYGTQLSCPDGYKMVSCSSGWGKTDNWDDATFAHAHRNTCQWVIDSPDCSFGHFYFPIHDFRVSYTCVKKVKVGSGKFGYRMCTLGKSNYEANNPYCGAIRYY